MENREPIKIEDKYYSYDDVYKVGKTYRISKTSYWICIGIIFIISGLNSILGIVFSNDIIIEDKISCCFILMCCVSMPGLFITIFCSSFFKKKRIIRTGISLIKKRDENNKKKQLESTKLNIKTSISTPKFYQSVSLPNGDVDEEDEEDNENIDDEESERNTIVLEALRLKAIQMGWDENEMSLEEFISYFM